MVCGKCSAINDDGDRFCYKCGAPLPRPEGAGTEGNAASGSASAKPGGGPKGFKFNFAGSRPRAAQAGSAPKQEKYAPTGEDRLTIAATTNIAVKKARIADVKSMRPLTQAAYNIVESERGPVVSTLISVANVLISLAIVAAVINIFETVNLIVKSYTSSRIEGSLGQIWQGASANNVQKLIWLVVIFAVLVFAFVICGRLSIRIRKVNRKKKRENIASRID